MPSLSISIIALLLASCISTSTAREETSLSYQRVVKALSQRPPLMDHFTRRGPIDYKKKLDFQIPISRHEKVVIDLFIPEQKRPTPLLIFQHGNKSSKDHHRYQAEIAASWGFNSLAIEQPNEGQWLSNGKRLGQFIELIYHWPKLLGPSFRRDKIILVGHSFGGSAIAIAAGTGAPVSGLIFLDPALVHTSVKGYLNRIQVPAVLLGADRSIFKSRRRKRFFHHYNGPIAEISIQDATHNDAQFPHLFKWDQLIGLEHSPNEDTQRQFAASIITAAISLAENESIALFLKAIEASELVSSKNTRHRS